MRRVRNHNIHSNNPAVMFASGLESLVRDQLHNPSKYDDQEIEALKRKNNKKEQPSLFSVLCHQLLWHKLVR